VTLKYSIIAATYWPHEFAGIDVLACKLSASSIRSVML
jgi:hypothetical protein